MSDRNTGYAYLPWIDGIRAVSVLAVMIYGLGFIPPMKGGFSVADVLFVIAGYVISHSQSRAVMSSGRDLGFIPFVLGFYSRRVLRIIPAMAVCLFITFLLFGSALSPEAGYTGLSAYLGLSPVYLAAQGEPMQALMEGMNPFLHTWFLGALIPFYLIFPLLFYFWLAGGRRGGILRFLSRLIVPLLFGLSLAFAALSRETLSLFYLFPGRLWEIAAGSLLFFLQTRWQFLSGGRAVGANLLLPVGFFMVLAGFFLITPGNYPVPWAFLPVGGTLLMLWGMGEGADRLTPVHAFLGSVPLVFWGKRAYSLYLWHWPVIIFLRKMGLMENLIEKVLAVLIIFIAGALSYRLVERPFRFGKSVRKGKGPLVILLGLLILGVISLLFFSPV